MKFTANGTKQNQDINLFMNERLMQAAEASSQKLDEHSFVINDDHIVNSEHQPGDTSIIHHLQQENLHKNPLKLKKTFSYLNYQEAQNDEANEIIANKIINDQQDILSDVDQQSSNQSENQYYKFEQSKLLQTIRQNKHHITVEEKMVIGTGFTFDMTQFFKFKKRELASDTGQTTFLDQISGSRIAWIILLYSITSSAMIPGWIMNIHATKLLRQCWRFLLQAFMIIPFVLYEKRTITPQNKRKYTFKYIFNHKNLIKPYVSSLSSSLWFLIILTCFEWTYVSHGIILGNLSNFFLSIGRSMRKRNHYLEYGGQILVILGVILIVQDSYTINLTVDDIQHTFQNTFYLKRSSWQRISADIIAIITSFIMSQFSKYTSDLSSYYPPFLSMTLVNIFNFLNIGLFSFFFNGATFDFDSYWGILSIFSSQHFVSFMFMAIVLAFGQMISVFIVTKMFPDPIIPALAMTFEPFIACFIVYLTNIQSLPGDLAMIGFIFIFPGILVVLIGQCFHQRQKQYTEQSDKRVQQLLSEVKLLKKMNHRYKELKQSPRKNEPRSHQRLYQSTFQFSFQKDKKAIHI